MFPVHYFESSPSFAMEVKIWFLLDDSNCSDEEVVRKFKDFIILNDFLSLAS